jgi:hypothetical protein
MLVYTKVCPKGLRRWKKNGNEGIEMTKEKTFEIEATAVQTFWFTVKAKNKTEAIKKFKELGYSCGDVIDGDYDILNFQTIEEKKEGASPSSAKDEDMIISPRGARQIKARQDACQHDFRIGENDTEGNQKYCLKCGAANPKEASA